MECASDETHDRVFVSVIPLTVKENCTCIARMMSKVLRFLVS